MNTKVERHLGFAGATGLGVGAIVGGGILALSGGAFALTGPSTILVFLLNGLLAIITALSFAELASTFPQSGGLYVFARRLLSVGPAFLVGWIVWFASILAALLYTIGFIAFILEAVKSIFPEIASLAFLNDPKALTFLSMLTLIATAYFITRSPGGGGSLINLLKIVVFTVLILGGIGVWAFKREFQVPTGTIWFPGGSKGFLQAMGLTFIALQGFDLIAAVSGEVKNPEKTLPRAMLASLGVALIVYIPLLIVLYLVGVSNGESIQSLALNFPETLTAICARNYLGALGYWLVVGAGILSMFSALLANIFAAARIAGAMAGDRTLMSDIERIHPRYGTPFVAIFLTTVITCLSLLIIKDVSQAGSASSLIFLLAFSLSHILCLLCRRRKQNNQGFKVPFFPWLPIIGLVSTSALALYQGVVEPRAGAVVLIWLLIGVALYLWIFGSRAKIFDEISESHDPELLEMRGRSPLVLVPIANPQNAKVMATIGGTIASPRVGRVLFLNIVKFLKDQAAEVLDEQMKSTSEVLHDSLKTALKVGINCEALASVSEDPWTEIQRIAETHRCSAILMGLSQHQDENFVSRMNAFLSSLFCHVVLLRTSSTWDINKINNVLIPVGGRRVNEALRARILAGLFRDNKDLKITYLWVTTEKLNTIEHEKREKVILSLIQDELPFPSNLKIVTDNDPESVIKEEGKKTDLLILGLAKRYQGQRNIGNLASNLIQNTQIPMLLISAKS